MSDDDKRGYKGGPIIAAAAVALLTAYVAGYFGLSGLYHDTTEAHPIRTFNSVWQAQFFRPALMVENHCRGNLWVEWRTSENTSEGCPVD